MLKELRVFKLITMRIKNLILMVIILLAVIPTKADGIKIGELYYNLDPTDLTASVTYEVAPGSSGDNYKGLTPNLVIPNEVSYDNSTYKVTSIGYSAFRFVDWLESVSLPNSLTRIERYAFENPINLKSLVVPDSVTFIGEYAFVNCESLESLTLGKSVTTIEEGAFHNPQSLKSVSLYSSIVNCEHADFISDFRGFKLNVRVNIIQDIDTYLKNGFESIYYLLIDNSGYSTRKVDADVDYYYNDVLIKNLVVPTGTRKIGNYAFYNSTIETVTFPDDLEEIGKGAFERCENIYDIPFRPGLNTIGDRAFADCIAIYNVAFPNSLTSIGDGVFSGCIDLEKVEINEGLTEVSRDAFRDCTRLSDVSLPSSLIIIGEGAFYGCKALSNIDFPEFVETIGADAFTGGVRISDRKSVV